MLDYAFELPSSEMHAYLETEMADIRYQKCMLVLESAVDDAKLKLRGAEIECLRNNGTVLDLMGYYEDATSNGSGKGILSRIWDAVLNLFGKIKTFLFGEKDEDDKIDPNTEVKVNKADWDATQKTISTWDKVKGEIKSRKPNTKGSAWKLILGVGAAIGAVGATVFITKRWKDVKSLNKESQKVLFEMESVAKQNRNVVVDPNDPSSVADAFIEENKAKSNCLTTLGKSLRDGLKAVKNSFKPGAGKKIKSLKAADKMDDEGILKWGDAAIKEEQLLNKSSDKPVGKELLAAQKDQIESLHKRISALRIRDSMSVNDAEYNKAKQTLSAIKDGAKPMMEEYNACKKDAEKGDAEAAKWVKKFEESIINPIKKAEDDLAKFKHKYD